MNRAWSCSILAISICLGSAGASVGIVDGKGTSGALALDNFPGVWKMCFHPKLEGLSEPDSAYRILLPGGDYIEFYGGQDQARYITHGTYRIEGHAVIFKITRKQYADGRRIEPTRSKLTYSYLDLAEVVLFDDLTTARRLPVLVSPTGALNYCYAKIF